MRFIKRSTRARPKVSLILLDWSVRDSFHLLHYLKQQTVARDDFEVIIIEYYGRVSEAILKFEDQVDSWIVLDMPAECYYHKHLMYNVGIVLARGEIIMIGDSDAMVKPTFIEAILRNFATNPGTVYHMDEFRNMRRDLYPFNFPSFEEVLGEGCFNNVGGRTSGVLNREDPIHTRNYGACMCARRDDLILIGGADMHIDYAGHICGPYEMTFRLVNHGRREVWDMTEFLYHTWHPGQAGADNYMGPHDGRHMSSTALEAITSRRVRPLLEHEAIRRLRTGAAVAADDLVNVLIDPRYAEEWNVAMLGKNGALRRWTDYRVPLGVYRGYRLEAEVDRVFAYPLNEPEIAGPQTGQRTWLLDGADLADVKRRIDEGMPFALLLLSWAAALTSCVTHAGKVFYRRSAQIPGPMSHGLKMVLAGIAIWPALPVLLISRPRFCIGKSRRMRAQVSCVANELIDLGIVLRGLARRESPAAGRTRPIVVTETLNAACFLKAFSWVGLLPPLTPRRVANLTQFERQLRKFEQGEPDTPFVLPRQLYVRFHPAISASSVSGRVLLA